MSVYRYPQSKVIEEITFKKTENGAIRAYLYAQNGDKAPAVLQALRGSGYECIPFTLDGKPTLEVRGFKREDDLLAFVKRHEWVEGEPAIQQDKADHISWLGKLRKRSLQASGVAMAVADIGFTVYGFQEAKAKKMINPEHRRDFSEALAGFSYLSGSTALTLYGRNDQSQFQIRDAAQLIINRAREQGYEVPGDSAANSLGGKPERGVLKKVDEFLHKHPSEIGNMLYFSAGALIASSALRHRALAKPRPEMTPKQIHEMRKGGWGDAGLGSTTMTAGLIGTFMKEKAIDPDAPHTHGIIKAVERLKSNPLTIASMLYLGSTACHAYTTYTETKEARRVVKDLSMAKSERAISAFKLKAIRWRILFICATILGEILLAISSKGHGEGVVSDDSVDKSIVAMTADMIVKQPRNLQDGLIDYMAGFLGRADVLALSDQDAKEKLRIQVEALRQNPWACTVSAAKVEPIPDVIAPASSKSIKPSWQTKVAAPENASAQPQLSA